MFFDDKNMSAGAAPQDDALIDDDVTEKDEEKTSPDEGSDNM